MKVIIRDKKGNFNRRHTKKERQTPKKIKTIKRMAFKLLKNSTHKVWAAILATVIALILILAFFINRYWSPILASKVKSAVLSSSDSLYNIDFSDAELHVLRGQLVIYNITLKPDTAVYNRRKLQHLAPNNLVTLHVKRLIIEHIHPFSLYFKHKLDIGQIIISEPDLNVSYQLNHTRDTVVKDNRTAWQKISKSLHSVHIGAIFFNDVKLKYEDYSGNKVAISQLKEMNLSASDLLIDSVTQFDKSRLLYCKEIVAELNNYTGKTANGLYSYKVNHVKLSTLTSQLNIEGFSLSPIKTEEFFNKTNLDRYHILIDSMQLNHFDYLSYHKYRMVHTNNMIIKKGEFILVANPNRTQDKTANKITGFPTIALSKLTTDLEIDTILMSRFKVSYSELNKKSHQMGTITFDNTKARILNVTNDKTALLKNNISTVQLSSYFMGRGKLNVAFTFDLTNKDAAYSYKGNLGQMDMVTINPATMPLSMVKITSGTLKDLNFDIHANSRVSKGKVNLLYNDLKIKLLKPDTTYGYSSKVIETLYANIFVIKHDNPDKPGEIPRSAVVTYVRPIYSTFFNSIWKTLLTGIKPAVGVDPKTEQATIELTNQKVIKKQQRLAKRAMRKQRRAERKQEKEQKKAAQSK